MVSNLLMCQKTFEPPTCLFDFVQIIQIFFKSQKTIKEIYQTYLLTGACFFHWYENRTKTYKFATELNLMYKLGG